MLADIEKFIYNDKIYSKCNAADKEMIDTFLHGVRQQLETFKEAYKQAQEEIKLLKRENKALADDNVLKCELNEELNKALDKACEELDFLNCRLLDHCNKYNRLNADEWKEWAMND